MFSPVAFAGTSRTPIGITDTNGVVAQFDTLVQAKKSTEDYIARNKTSFANGYEVYILDRDAHVVASFASLPVPSLTWTDTK